MNVPVYDFPNSPILILGFLGILVAIATLFIAYSKYFNSPLNIDKKFVKNSLEFEFKKFSSKVSWNSKLLKEVYSNFQMSPLGKFIVLIICFTGITTFYPINNLKNKISHTYSILITS